MTLDLEVKIYKIMAASVIDTNSGRPGQGRPGRPGQGRPERPGQGRPERPGGPGEGVLTGSGDTGSGGENNGSLCHCVL